MRPAIGADCVGNFRKLTPRSDPSSWDAQPLLHEHMMNGRKTLRMPKIVTSASEHERLTAFAEAIAARSTLGAALQNELVRATVVEDKKMPDDVVRMGSIVTYRIEGSEARTVTLVFPVEANIDAGRISILTPVGTALLGLSPGQTMPWKTNGGEVRRLLVTGVRQPD